MGSGQLLFSVGVLAIGHFIEHYDAATLQTLAFVTVVCGNQATTYNNRERRRIWSSRPSWPLVISSLIDTSLACGLAWAGLAMSPLPPLTVAAIVGAAIVFAFAIDFVKVPVFEWLSIG
jgi:H+-transporting ATPase